MKISAATLLVPDYDAGIEFYVGRLGFILIEDVELAPGKRWVKVAPKSGGCALVLARATKPEQIKALGNQTGSGVSFFLETDDFGRDHAAFLKAGVEFLEEPRHEPYGTVAVFSDPWGILWDLIQPA